MQTFLPYADFATSAGVLDMKRLGKQRVETMQIMKALLTGAGWINHPATKMWQGHEIALLDYQLAVCDEWAVVRGYRDTCADKTIALVREYLPAKLCNNFFTSGVSTEPAWLGDASFHVAHQSNLLRKDPEFYGPIFQGVPSDLEYVWPSRKV